MAIPSDSMRSIKLVNRRPNLSRILRNARMGQGHARPLLAGGLVLLLALLVIFWRLLTFVPPSRASGALPLVNPRNLLSVPSAPAPIKSHLVSYSHRQVFKVYADTN